MVLCKNLSEKCHNLYWIANDLCAIIMGVIKKKEYKSN